MSYKLNIAWFYPDLMSTYGDRGNIIVLQNRCEYRHIIVEIVPITLETHNTKLDVCDLIFMGGAQDRQQKILGDDLLKNKGPQICEMVEQGIPALFVCAAYQIVGKYYKSFKGDIIPGLGLFDLITVHPGDQAKRLIGNVVATLINPHLLESQSIVGFENHGGRTTLGKKLKPLAKILSGFGNNGEDGYEGAFYKNAIGSYLHGPILPKNPHLADWLISKALEKKYQINIKLNPLDDALELTAHNYILNNRR